MIRGLVADPTVAVARGRTLDNGFLAPAFVAQIVRRYEGTRLGRQELDAEILDDAPGALWSRALIEAARVAAMPGDLVRIVVAIDPAVTSGEDADETGIIVAGKAAGADGQGYVLGDASGRYAPPEWAKAAILAYRTHHADRIVAEVNNGGEMVEAMMRVIDPECRRLPRCVRRAARSRGPNRSPRCTSRAGSTISAPSRYSKTRCAPSVPISTGRSPAIRPTASTRWSGR